jgi:hypothetical protein
MLPTPQFVLTSPSRAQILGYVFWDKDRLDRSLLMDTPSSTQHISDCLLEGDRIEKPSIERRLKDLKLPHGWNLVPVEMDHGWND